MIRNSVIFCGVLLVLLPFISIAQGYRKYIDDSSRNIKFNIGILGIATGNGDIPFWMRTNQYGSIPLDGTSGSILAAVKYPFSNTYEDQEIWYRNKFDWSTAIEARLNVGNKINAQIIQADIRLRYSIFQLAIGRSKDKIGLVDTSLSSGAFSVSGNALGTPKIEISVPEYWNLPGTRKLIALKGNFAFGYMGLVDARANKLSYEQHVSAFYHQKSLYGRIGKPSWKLNFYAGFNHQVMFGDEKKYLGPTFDLSPLTTFIYVATGKAYGNDSILRSKIGNHIGSIDQAVSYDFRSCKVTGYHQFFYDVGGLYHLSNIKDGLWGLSLENKKEDDCRPFYWHKFLVEFLYSKSQGGELREKPTPSGDEDYYNNYIYTNGWAYDGENIGSNFFTNKKYQRKDLPQYKGEYIGNNRIILLHLGMIWKLSTWTITNKFSFSRNYGTYATSPIGNTTGSLRSVQPPPYFTPVNQFSGYMEASRPLKHNLRIGFVFAGDYGDLLYNSVGGMVKLTKSF